MKTRLGITRKNGVATLIQYDSRKVKQGDTFLCLPNATEYIEAAKANGAKGITHCTRPEMAKIASDYFNHPSSKMTIIGITGTNGKTTTINLVGQILKEAGHKPYLIGTITGNLTTPESVDLQRIMAERLAEEFSHIVMEVSSIGIDQHRVDEIDFDIKLLTNITIDHLDYHKTFENYKKSKMYFLNDMPGQAIFPEEWSNYEINYPIALEGTFNYLNAQAAATICKKLGIDSQIIKTTLEKAHPVPGRFEHIDEGQDFFVFVDYAHTPDGLENILNGAADFQAAKKLSGKIITVFGCGGDRDKTKRPIMGNIAKNKSDLTYITSDNPRTENPNTIINEILIGIKDKTNIYIEPDRHKAIIQAIEKANTNDIVILAGKGHETYQIIGTESIHFDDREEARKAIKGKAT